MNKNHVYFLQYILLLFYMTFLSACSTITNEERFVKNQNEWLGEVVFNDKRRLYVGYKSDYHLDGNPEDNNLVDNSALKLKKYNVYLNVQKIQKINDNEQKWSFIRNQCRYTYFVKRHKDSKESLNIEKWLLQTWQFDSNPKYCKSFPRTVCILGICP